MQRHSMKGFVMIEWFHAVALLAFGFMMTIWSGKGGMNIMVKLAWGMLTCWAAVIVAKDFFL